MQLSLLTTPLTTQFMQRRSFQQRDGKNQLGEWFTEKGMAEWTNYYTEKEQQLQMAYLEKPKYEKYII